MTERVLLTPAGEVKLRAELKSLKSVERPAIVAAVAEARAHGDLSENAEYHAAREQHSFIEGRIKELESKLSVAEVIDPAQTNVEGKVIFGSYVVLFDIESEEEVTYQIVGDLESDVENAKISVNSPIARALIGKEIDDEVKFQAPGGQREFEVVDVRYTDI